MQILSQVIRQLRQRIDGRRSFTALEVRDYMQRGDLASAEAAIDNLSAQTPQLELTRLCLRGELAFQRGDDDRAQEMFNEAVKQAPGLPAAHYGLSLVKLTRGQADEALRHALFASRQSTEARFEAQLGLCQLEVGNHGAAAEALARATRLDAHDWSSWNNLGIARRAKGDGLGARDAFLRALEIRPDFAQARDNLSTLDAELSRLKDKAASDGATGARVDQATAQDASSVPTAEALEAAERLCLDRPDDGDAAIALADLHVDRGDARSAIDVLRAFVTRQPEHFEARRALALAMVRERMHKPALGLLTALAQERPDDEAVLTGLAAVHTERGAIEAAGELLERVFELKPTLHNKGRLAASYAARCQYQKVLRLVDEMLAEDRRCEEALLDVRVDALTNLGMHDEALPLLDRAIEVNPRDAHRRFLRASVHLLNERFGPGWDDYSFRQLSSVKHLRTLALPEWKGEPLEGKRIVVLCEQGLGDQVMFASCLPDLLALAPARVVVEAVERVAPTLARSFPGCEVVASKQDAAMEWLRDRGDFDYYVAIGDLPRVFRRQASSFLRHEGYLTAAPERVMHWRRVLESRGEGPYVGISWRGGTEVTRKALRTMKAVELAQAVARAHVQQVCLQYGDVGDDLRAVEQAGISLSHWPEAIQDLDEFAALISALDLVVTVCNTTVHYAGALAKPLWVMAPRVPEWRYGLRFRSLPWYPTSRMYRQTRDRDWAEVLAAVERDLVTQFGRRQAGKATFAHTAEQD
jgi:tetratricopeptide (TPR) repeat protein